MGNIIDLTGNRYGRWTVIKIEGRTSSGGSAWLCECDCGTKRVVSGSSLKQGLSNSCGCLGKEHREKAAADAARKHGGKNERLYNVWQGIKERCCNKRSKYYSHYGGRGITICEQWLDYAVFREWANANGYDPTAPKGACTIDRIDNDKGYYPDNCRWVPSVVQCNNRRNNHMISYNGKTQTISQWSREVGIRKDTLRRRIEIYGWSVERALTQPVNQK